MKKHWSGYFGPNFPGKICGARTKRTGEPCKNPAILGSERCRMHGGQSTGPRTKEGMDRMRRANTKHGLYAGPKHPDLGFWSGPLWYDRKLAGVRRKVRESSRILMRLKREEG